MAKLQVFDVNGNKAKEITSNAFDSPIRTDIVQKIVETEKKWQPYAPFWKAGLQTSASGNVKHNRHTWKTDRGKGLSRYPKKRMSDKGERFVWVAAAIPGVRGGRRAHPPKVISKELKINKKERQFGFVSALAMIASSDLIKKKYQTINAQAQNINVKFPFVVESKLLSLKTGQIIESIKKILGEPLFAVAVQKKSIRAGIGKMRSRRYKFNAGMLLVIGDKQDKKINGIEVKKVKEVKITDLADNGARLVMFTEDAVKDMETRISGEKTK